MKVDADLIGFDTISYRPVIDDKRWLLTLSNVERVEAPTTIADTRQIQKVRASIAFWSVLSCDA